MRLFWVQEMAGEKNPQDYRNAYLNRTNKVAEELENEILLLFLHLVHTVPVNIVLVAGLN